METKQDKTIKAVLKRSGQPIEFVQIPTATLSNNEQQSAAIRELLAKDMKRFKSDKIEWCSLFAGPTIGHRWIMARVPTPGSPAPPPGARTTLSLNDEYQDYVFYIESQDITPDLWQQFIDNVTSGDPKRGAVTKQATNEPPSKKALKEVRNAKSISKRAIFLP